MSTCYNDSLSVCSRFLAVAVHLSSSLIAVDTVDHTPVEEVQPTVESAELQQPYFTKELSRSIIVKPNDTATLLANIAGVPRPEGRRVFFFSFNQISEKTSGSCIVFMFMEKIICLKCDIG